MLFFPVFTEVHPRRNAVQAASCTSSAFSNSFLPRAKGRGAFSPTSHFKAKVSLNSFEIRWFRTLASHFQTSVSSNLFEIKRFRTLCKIPGIGYPPPSHFLDSFFFGLLNRRPSRCVPRTHELRFFLPRVGARGAEQVFCLPHACPERIRAVRISWGKGA